MEEEQRKKAEEHIKRFREAGREYSKLGPLGATAAQIRAIGGSPGERLAKSPGKTLGQLMSDPEILEYLQKEKTDITNASASKVAADLKNVIERSKQDLKVTVGYLRSIGRLPKEFEAE